HPDDFEYWGPFQREDMRDPAFIRHDNPDMPGFVLPWWETWKGARLYAPSDKPDHKSGEAFWYETWVDPARGIVFLKEHKQNRAEENGIGRSYTLPMMPPASVRFKPVTSVTADLAIPNKGKFGGHEVLYFYLKGGENLDPSRIKLSIQAHATYLV